MRIAFVPLIRRMGALVWVDSFSLLSVLSSSLPLMESWAWPVSSAVKVYWARRSTEMKPVISAVKGVGFGRWKDANGRVLCVDLIPAGNAEGAEGAEDGDDAEGGEKW